MRIFDHRPTLSRSEALSVYDKFALQDHTGGKDVSSGYGGPAIRALLSIAAFSTSENVLEFGCGQGKLAQLVLEDHPKLKNWYGFDQSSVMVQKAQERLRGFQDQVRIELLENGHPQNIMKNVKPKSMDRFVSTYVLDLLSEDDMYEVLDVAEQTLHPNDGLLLLAGITWGYRDSPLTFFMTLLWEVLYQFVPKKVGGCRPQRLEPYLKEKGWKIVECVRTLPEGFPWMASEVIAARPPKSSS